MTFRCKIITVFLCMQRHCHWDVKRKKFICVECTIYINKKNFPSFPSFLYQRFDFSLKSFLINMDLTLDKKLQGFQQIAQEKLQSILCSIPSSQKDLVIETCLIKPFEHICGASWLRYNLYYFLFVCFIGIRLKSCDNFIFQSKWNKQNLQIRFKESAAASTNNCVFYIIQFNYIQICIGSNPYNKWASASWKANVGYGNKTISHNCIANSSS